jgi:UDP-glucose 4-epimerase
VSYEGKRVVVTGGLGFIGSNLVLRLVEQGALVTVVDSCVLGCGANLYNVAAASGKVEILKADIGEPDCIAPALSGVPVIFNLAGEISHIHSMLYPERDLEINASRPAPASSTPARAKSMGSPNTCRSTNFTP